MCYNTLHLTSFLQYPSGKWWVKGVCESTQGCECFSYLLSLLITRSQGTKGVFIFLVSLLMGTLRVQAGVPLRQCKTPLHKNLSIPMQRHALKCLGSAFILFFFWGVGGVRVKVFLGVRRSGVGWGGGGGQWANSSLAAVVMSRCAEVSHSSGGLGGAHAWAPQNNRPNRVGRLGDHGSWRLSDDHSSAAGDEMLQYLEVGQRPINQE